MADETTVEVGGERVRISSPGKVVFPEQGWTKLMVVEHFVGCVKNGTQPLETGEDGRAVLEIIMAAYESAATGRRIDLPFQTQAKTPIEPWLRRRS